MFFPFFCYTFWISKEKAKEKGKKSLAF